MIHKFKNLSRLSGKKRYILLGFLAVELLSWPAAAKIVHKTAFEVPKSVTAVEIPTSETGISRFLVTSNAAFNVTSDTVAGDISVKVHVRGSLAGETPFGGAAQLPGPETICAKATGPSSAIYKADRKIEAHKGTAPERAIMMVFNYEPMAVPDFKFEVDKNKTLQVSRCSS